jgi:hypothetical protein
MVAKLLARLLSIAALKTTKERHNQKEWPTHPSLPQKITPKMSDPYPAFFLLIATTSNKKF